MQDMKQLTKEEENKIADHIGNLTAPIEWGNWEAVDDDGDRLPDEYMKLGEVFFSKLDWLKEYMQKKKQDGENFGDDTSEEEEFIDLITTLQDDMCPILSILDPQ